MALPTPAGSIILHNLRASRGQASVDVRRTPWPSPLDRDAVRGACADEQVYVHVLEGGAYQLGTGLQEPDLTNVMTYLTKPAGLLPQMNEELEDVLHEIGRQGQCENCEVQNPNR